MGPYFVMIQNTFTIHWQLIPVTKNLKFSYGQLLLHHQIRPTSEKLCLKWNYFEENVNTAFRDLRKDSDFTDVTLACEDGHQVETHKVILAASSQFFQNLLKKKMHNHPLIYMRGMKSEELTAIVDFLYFGEANIFQEHLGSFLNIAEELHLKGLNGTEGGEEDGVCAKTPNQTCNTNVPSNETQIKNDTMKTQSRCYSKD